jgi:hypothetical protein
LRNERASRKNNRLGEKQNLTTKVRPNGKENGLRKTDLRGQELRNTSFSSDITKGRLESGLTSFAVKGNMQRENNRSKRTECESEREREQERRLKQ